MTETPSGNRWEPTDDTTRPLTSTPPTVPPTTVPPTTPSPTAAEPVAAPEYGWAPAPQPLEAEPPRRGRRRTGALAAGAAALVIGATAGGYAIGSATSGSDRQGFGTTRQAPPGGFAPGQGFPDRDGSGDDHDHGPFDGPDGSTDDGS
jgi:hypothetical protein